MQHSPDMPRNIYGFPGTDDRVPLHTSDRNNTRIHEHTLKHIRPYVGAPRRKIDARIAQLRREWDIERTLEAHAAAVSLASVALGLTVSKKFFVVPALIAGFMFQHAVQGWCPPLPALRRMGVRTSAEIHAEILALRILRDDFSERSRGAEAALSVALDS